MPLLQIALWEARDGPLELIALHIGETHGHRNIWALEPAQTAPGTSWEESVYPRDRERLLAYLGSTDVIRTRKAIDYRLIVGDGDLLWVRHWLLSRSRGDQGRHHLSGLLMAIPEQKHLEWECLRVSEHECNRIGQELHDDLCQVLAGLSFMMRVLGQRAARLAPALSASVEELNSHVAAATERVRSMAHGLFPAQLHYVSLRHALKELARQIAARFSVKVTLDFPPKFPTHTPEQIIHVFRIAQEAITNAVHHGKARTVRLVVTPAPREVQMTIENDGDVFPANAVRPEGIGIHIMQYRAGVLGGRLEFKNLSPRGAAVHLTYPAARTSKRRPHANP
jgi:signal transduction histidine kinase